MDNPNMFFRIAFACKKCGGTMRVSKLFTNIHSFLNIETTCPSCNAQGDMVLTPENLADFARECAEKSGSGAQQLMSDEALAHLPVKGKPN